MRTILFMLFMLIFYLCIGTVLGLKWVVLLSALLFLTMATVFLIREDYYITYIKLVNPSYLKTAEEKGEKFKKQNRITNIVCWYILAVVFLFEGSVMANMKLLDLFSAKQLFAFSAAIFAFSTIMFAASIFVYRKSKTNAQFIGYSVIIGVIVSIILFIVTGVFIYRSIVSHITFGP